MLSHNTPATAAPTNNCQTCECYDLTDLSVNAIPT